MKNQDGLVYLRKTNGIAGEYDTFRTATHAGIADQVEVGIGNWWGWSGEIIGEGSIAASTGTTELIDQDAVGARLSGGEVNPGLESAEVIVVVDRGSAVVENGDLGIVGGGSSLRPTK